MARRSPIRHPASQAWPVVQRIEQADSDEGDEHRRRRHPARRLLPPRRHARNGAADCATKRHRARSGQHQQPDQQRRTRGGREGRSSLEPDPRIDHGVGNVGEDQPDDVEQRTDEDHRAHDGEVLRGDRVDGVAAQPGMPKNDSVSSEPMNSSRMTTTTPVRIGIIAFAARGEKHGDFREPLARAVRT